VGLSIKGENNVAGRRTKEKQTDLCGDKVAGEKGWHNKEIKPKESKHAERLVVLGVEGH
jgi:hypothetical protein